MNLTRQVYISMGIAYVHFKENVFFRSVLTMFPEQGYNFHCPPHHITGISHISDVVSKLSLVDLNIVLYRCDNEEKNGDINTGVYDIPRFGRMVYCGLQGY